MESKDLQQFQIIVSQLLEAEKKQAVVPPINVSSLFEQLDISLSEEGETDNKFYKSLTELVLNTPRTASNGFFNQLFGGRRSKAVLGDLLAVMLNSSMYTYKIAGPMVGVEKEIIRQSAYLLGYDKNFGGTLAPGGSMSNFMAMVMARDTFQEDIRFEGVSHKMTLYTSENSHYSIEKNAALMGIGRRQVRYIPTDKKGIMSIIELEKQILLDKKDGFHPFFINATAGTTVLGAFDPIEEVATICEKYQLWLHVDGAYCGAVIFSKKYNHLIKGAERANSYSFNAQKMLGTPLTCSVLLCKNKHSLRYSFSNEASYLYQSESDEYNLGKTSLQCGRRNDALKLWTLWKSVGRKGLEAMVDHQFYLADIAREYVRDHPDYTLYSHDNSISICFNYKNISAKRLCQALYENAELMVSHGTFKNNTFIRLVTINSDNNKETILAFFSRLEAFVVKNISKLEEEKVLSK